MPQLQEKNKTVYLKSLNQTMSNQENFQPVASTPPNPRRWSWM